MDISINSIFIIIVVGISINVDGMVQLYTITNVISASI